MGYYKKDRDFHEARWDEPIIMEIGNPGERGVLVPKADERVFVRFRCLQFLFTLRR